MSEEEPEVLKQLKKIWSEEALFFSNKRKEGREKWIVSKFLSVLEVDFSETELECVEQQNVKKIDVCFRDAHFQVKELTDPDTTITKDVKEFNRAIQNANSLADVKYVSPLKDIPPIAQEYDLIFDWASYLARDKYVNTKGELDLLIYTTRTRAGLIQINEIEQETLSELGWRSISCVNEKQAVVLYSAERAPEFLYELSGRIIKSRR